MRRIIEYVSAVLVGALLGAGTMALAATAIGTTEGAQAAWNADHPVTAIQMCRFNCIAASAQAIECASTTSGCKADDGSAACTSTLAGKRQITLQNEGAAVVTLGSSAVANAKGMSLAPGASVTFTLPSTQIANGTLTKFYCIAGGTVAMSLLEAK